MHLTRTRSLQMVGVAALGAAMVAATLIVGLGVDGRKPASDRPVPPDAGPLSRLDAAPSSRPADPPSGHPGRAGLSADGQRTAPMPIDAQRAAALAVTVRSWGSLAKDKHSLKVVFARADLTGQRELAWAADAGHRVGSDRCTRNVRIGHNAGAGTNPAMLLCWRTSAKKSVYTLAVDAQQPPSERASVAKLDETWTAMR